ncbi:MAG: hypothetical protein JW700_01520 [Candidatus Aenigmarchaeota archaeon]|nr:hypothetical protein [Candidatus Aenigmarchaeota archaeon]
MKFQKEYFHSLIGVIVIVLVYLLFVFTQNVMLQILFSVLSMVAGSAMVVLGFWGSDFAFAMTINHLDQSKEKGKINGQKNKVYVPFIGNYTPLEWWNINWFITLSGVFLVALGCLTIGIMAGVYVF